jgi:hypothetical protein
MITKRFVVAKITMQLNIFEPGVDLSFSLLLLSIKPVFEFWGSLNLPFKLFPYIGICIKEKMIFTISRRNATSIVIDLRWIMAIPESNSLYAKLNFYYFVVWMLSCPFQQLRIVVC